MDRGRRVRAMKATVALLCIGLLGVEGAAHKHSPEFLQFMEQHKKQYCDDARLVA